MASLTTHFVGSPARPAHDTSPRKNSSYGPAIVYDLRERTKAKRDRERQREREGEKSQRSFRVTERNSQKKLTIRDFISNSPPKKIRKEETKRTQSEGSSTSGLLSREKVRTEEREVRQS